MPSPTAQRSLEPPASLALVGERVVTRVDEMLAQEQARWSTVDPDLERPIEALRSFIAAGGKRLRPVFCYWAFVGAGCDPDDPVIIDVGGALELLHTFAIIHDDIMDGSDRRRGRPSMHTAFIAEHGRSGWRGEARRFGEGAAILVGDLSLVYADCLVGELSDDARRVFNDVRIEVSVGQFLDLVAAARGRFRPELAVRIERYKSSKYTVERPLHLGAALAGRLDALAAPLSAVGIPLGEAFQLRDDILGVYGDTKVTGKPIGDDLREGKVTPLLAAAMSRERPDGSNPFARVGARDLDVDEIAELQEALVESGALEETEEAIAVKVAEALDAIERLPVTDPAKVALAELATYVAWRDS